MLKELNKYKNLGSSKYFYMFLSLFHDHPNIHWNKKNIEDHFRNKVIDGKSNFDGGIEILVQIGVIRNDTKGNYYLTRKFRNKFNSFDDFEKELLESLIRVLKEDKLSYNFFLKEKCDYDFDYKTVKINKSAFGLNYIEIRDVLYSLKFLIKHPRNQNDYLINNKYKNLFEKYFSNELRRKQTPQQLDLILEKQKENGIIAEKFVLEYEAKRTERYDEIQWIAPYDTSAGYDISSYEDKSSQEHDRFIEVKGYKGIKPYFYWSRNEIEIAKQRKNQYFLYLVDINQIEEDSYQPKIIKNPACEIFQKKDWKITTENYRIDQKDLTT